MIESSHSLLCKKEIFNLLMKMAVYKKEKGDKMCNGEHFK
jgi:hypothetical protein